jgi:hypothetical protein
VSDAVSERGAAALDVRDSSGDGEALGEGDAEGREAAGAREAEASSGGGSAGYRVEVGQLWLDGLNLGDALLVREVDGLDRAVLALVRGGRIVDPDFFRWPVNRWRALVAMQQLELA